MRSILRRRPSPATVLASIALLVALGGTGVAAMEAIVPNNSVGTPQLKASAVTAGKIAPNAVTNVKIANNAVSNAKIGTNAITNSKLAGGAVTSAKVQNNSLLAADFAPNQLPRGATGPTGPQGPAGPAGQAGAAGPPGLSSVQIVVETSVTDSGNKGALVTCPAGKKLIGGGASTLGDAAGVYLGESNPDTANNGWHAVGREIATTQQTGGDLWTGDWRLVVYAICAIAN
jgi:hypothetical protein